MPVFIISLLMIVGIVILAMVLLGDRSHFSLKTLFRKFTSGGGKTSRVSGETERKLLRLLNGDRRTANRLVANMQMKNPDKSAQWCWEKVIFDLQRDRHSS